MSAGRSSDPLPPWLRAARRRTPDREPERPAAPGPQPDAADRDPAGGRADAASRAAGHARRRRHRPRARRPLGLADAGRRRARRGGRRAVREPRPAVRGRRRGRVRPQVGRVDGARGGRRLPRLRRGDRRDVRRTSCRRVPASHRLRRLRRDPRRATAALLWQRFHRIRLPAYLAFFGGRRFVPIVTAGAALALGVLLAFAYPAFDAGLTSFGGWLVGNDVLGAGIYGVANRLLVPFGLHHLLNSVPWFVVGSYQTPAARPCTATSPGSCPGTRRPARS